MLRTPAETSWTKYSTELFTGAEVFSFVCFVMFILFFLTLVIFQSAVTDHLGMSERRARGPPGSPNARVCPATEPTSRTNPALAPSITLQFP